MTVKKKAKVLKYGGKSYETKKALAADVGIKLATLNNRLSKGLTLKQAIDYKPKGYIKFKGKGYNSKADLLRDLAPKVTPAQFNHHLKKSDGSIAKALKAALKLQDEKGQDKKDNGKQNSKAKTARSKPKTSTAKTATKAVKKVAKKKAA